MQREISERLRCLYAKAGFEVLELDDGTACIDIARFSPDTREPPMRRRLHRAFARRVALVTGPIHENGFLKRTHGERLNASMVVAAGSVFGLWATYSVPLPILAGGQCVALAANISFPSPLRDSAGFTPASRLTKHP